MLFEEFKQGVSAIEDKYLKLRRDDLNAIVKTYLDELPIHVGDRIRYLRPQGALEGVVEKILVLTVPDAQVNVKLKGRKPFYDINPDQVEIINNQ